VTAGPAAVLDAAATVTLAEIAGRGVLGEGPVGAKDAAVAFAAAVAAAGIVLDRGADSLARAVGRSAWLGVLASGLVLAHARARVDLHGVIGLAVAVTAITLAAGGAMRLVGALGGSPARGRLAVCVGLALAATGPLWLGPAVERLGGAEAAVDAVVAASPLTCLAVVSDVDYLHRSWFYARSPVASLRFAYPDPTMLTACWLAVGIALVHAARVLPERRRRG
jgi:hypothetical protein